MRRLCEFGLSEKALYTAFLLVMGVGYLMAMVYLYTSHRGHDGRPGLSIEDIADNYFGNRSGSRLEAAVRGPMAGYIDVEDRNDVVAWLKSGAPESDYALAIQPILSKSCLACHDPSSGLNVPDFTTYAGIKAFSEVDLGESLHTLMKLSHIHLFGIGLILFGVGMVFVRATMPEWLRTIIIVVPFGSVIVDIAAWFLTKWDPVYAHTIVITGVLMGLSLGTQILFSLYQIWFLKGVATHGR